MTLGDAYCRHLRPLKVSAITTEDVLKVLKPIWRAKAETASRLRGRIERVLAFAKVKGWRCGENPALWRGHLDATLARPQEAHARSPCRDALCGRSLPSSPGCAMSDGMAARALEFAILTAGRSGEVLGAKWDEIDLDRAIWTVPASRMKAGKQHQVPLSPRAVTILKQFDEQLETISSSPGSARIGRCPVMSMEMLLRRFKVKDATTVHGFRRSFSDWTGDRTPFPREIAEAALAHTLQGVETELTGAVTPSRSAAS